jgi:hypothetical protein
MKEWQAKPLHFEALVSEKIVTNPTDGTELGKIISSSFNFNSHNKQLVRYIKVQGTNGAEYHGKYAEGKDRVALKRLVTKEETDARIKNYRRGGSTVPRTYRFVKG